MKSKMILPLIVLIMALGIAAFMVWSTQGDVSTDESPNIAEVEVSAQWTRYQNSEPSFAFAYPETMYLSKDGGDAVLLSVSGLSPDDPRRASDIGLFSSFNIRVLQEASIDSYVQTIEKDPLTEQFTSSNIELNNGAIVPTISYRNAFGARVHESFVNTGNGKIVTIWFVGDTEYTDTFFDILRSFELAQ